MTVLRGKVSWFGGPKDHGVSPNEGLAFIYSVEDAPYLFLPEQPPGTTGLARRLDPEVHYIACRWDYNVTPKKMLPGMLVDVYAPSTGRSFKAWPADWGPHKDTGRIADISSGLMADLGIVTDDVVEVRFLEPMVEEATMLKPAFIDLSHHNVIPSSLVPARESGIVGVIHKLSEGKSYVDDKVEARWVLARDAGMLWGLYHFVRPGDMKQQADFFVDKAEELGVCDDDTLWCLDWEDKGVSLQQAIDFMKRVETLTFRPPVLYSGHVLKESGLPNAEIAAYRLWLAQYSSKPTLPKGYESWWGWQYTDKGTVPGINYPVDLNAYDGTESELRHDWSGTGMAPAPEPEPEPAPDDVRIDISVPEGMVVHIRVNGETR